ncbi:hypothetical protein F0562_016703 [Nyssa sinensis]|uniref:Uncharacterized protein n=1 Tax=Nyssa sinensis TaxID=561372 RepID=A0A5J4ZD82_9ASTE|nr:hypothetical protein F0562_016703 [Nyssa sinensis]
MEENNNNAPAINSVDVDKVLHSSMVYWNKKRKFPAEHLGLPLPKHKCWDRKFSLEYDFPSNENLKAEDFHGCIITGKTNGGAKDTNGFTSDTDSNMSESCEAKNESEYTYTSPCDCPSSSSGDWGSSCFKNALHSFNCKLVTKSGADTAEPPYICREHNSPRHESGPHYDEHLQEFGNHVDYSCLEHGNDSIEQCADKELEDMLYYSNGVNSNNYVLSSGRWVVNQETQPGTKKLTIDKEFEQYFSRLML